MDIFILNFLHEKIVASYIQFEVTEIEKEIEYKKELIHRLKRGSSIKYNENSVSDIDDQKQIIYDMYKKLDKDKFEAFSDSYPSVFMHVDYVRCLYKENDMKLPLWFSEKYRHLFAEK